MIRDIALWALIYFIAFSLSSGIHKFVLNKRTVLWNITSALSILCIVYSLIQSNRGFDWNDPKTYIGFLFFAVTGWIYPELFKATRDRIEMKV